MHTWFTKALQLGVALLVAIQAPQASAADYFFEDFSGPALDATRWDVADAVSGMRWCSDTVEAHTTNPGVWTDVSTTACHFVTQAAPYGSVTFTVDPDGTTGARLDSAYPHYTFPYLAAGPGLPRSPFPPEGDFTFEIRLRYEALSGHGDGVVLTGWSDPVPSGNNPPSPAGLGVWGTWGDSSISRPVGVWQVLRLEYTGGVYTAFVDGVSQGSWTSAVRPQTLWLGNPVVTFWGLNFWSPFTVDYVRVTVPDIEVQIDIKPGSFPNSINLGSSGAVPVAVLSSPTFDATTIDPTTVTLASAPVRLKGNGSAQASFEDVNGDGLLDLVVQVSTAALGLSATDTEAVLEATSADGTTRVHGTDSVRVVP